MRKLLTLLFILSSCANAQQRSFDINASLENFSNIESIAACSVTLSKTEKVFREQGMSEESRSAKIFKDSANKIAEEYLSRNIGAREDFFYFVALHAQSINGLPFDKILFAFSICAEKVGNSFR